MSPTTTWYWSTRRLTTPSTARDFHHFQAEIAELMRRKEITVRPAERDPGYALLRLQLREKNELALIRFASLEDILKKQRADGSVRRARFRGDGGEFLLHRRNDLRVDRRSERVAVCLRCPPPQHVDADRTDDDRGEDKAGNREANADSHHRPNITRRPRKPKPAPTGKGLQFIEPLICSQIPAIGTLDWNRA